MFQLIVLIILVFSLCKAVEAYNNGDDDVRRLATVSALFCAMIMLFSSMP